MSALSRLFGVMTMLVDPSKAMPTTHPPELDEKQSPSLDTTGPSTVELWHDLSDQR